MFGNLGDLANLMKNAGKIRETMEKAAEELGRIEVKGEAGGGGVVVTMNGRMEVTSVRIDPKLTADVELLEDMVVAATNAALAKVRETAAQSFQALGGMPNLPNVFGGGGS